MMLVSVVARMRLKRSHSSMSNVRGTTTNSRWYIRRMASHWPFHKTAELRGGTALAGHRGCVLPAMIVSLPAAAPCA
jgi:hypothetical protein